MRWAKQTHTRALFKGFFSQHGLGLLLRNLCYVTKIWIYRDYGNLIKVPQQQPRIWGLFVHHMATSSLI